MFYPFIEFQLRSEIPCHRDLNCLDEYRNGYYGLHHTQSTEISCESESHT